ncbi:MAG: hypothetical protein Q9195_004058 [Heterodermia aff. obscurata]
MSSPSSLESLPAEIKRMIINALPDLKTLQCLVHASPSFHAMYANARETIFTEFTLQQLESKRVNLFQPMASLFVFHRESNAANERYILDAVRACVKWIRRPKQFKLSVDFCLKLLRVERIMPMSSGGTLLRDEGCYRRFEPTMGMMIELDYLLVHSQS